MRGKTCEILEFKYCEVIEDTTPERQPSEKVYLCRCKLCGALFTRCAKTLIHGRSDCGCYSGRDTRYGYRMEKFLREASDLSKKIIHIKLNALKLHNAAAAFEALYILNKPYCEHTAISIGMSMSTLYRARRQIYAVWTHEQKRRAEEAQGG